TVAHAQRLADSILSSPAAAGVDSATRCMREVELKGRRYWILSEPNGEGWRSSVVELLDSAGDAVEPVGIEASAVTRGASDAAAGRKPRRLPQLPPLAQRTKKPPPSHPHPVDEEQDDGAEQRHQVAGAVVGAIPARGPADPAAEQRARNAEEDRHDDAAGVAAGHQQLGERANNQAEDDPSNHAEH